MCSLKVVENAVSRLQGREFDDYPRYDRTVVVLEDQGRPPERCRAHASRDRDRADPRARACQLRRQNAPPWLARPQGAVDERVRGHQQCPSTGRSATEYA